VPVVTLGALELGTLFSGAVLTEQIFSVPGFGKLIVDAVFNRDYPVVQGVVLVTATIYVTLNLLADVLYVVINPRLRQRIECHHHSHAVGPRVRSRSSRLSPARLAWYRFLPPAGRGDRRWWW